MNIKNQFDLVIFDWAGTMVDFGCQAPVIALIEAFAAEGVAIDEAAARRDMGVAKIDHVRGLLRVPSIAAAWAARHGAPPDDRAVAALLSRLEPLMREQAARASTLIPGARECFDLLRAAGLRVASSTGYTRNMMQGVLPRAAEQGRKDHGPRPAPGFGPVPGQGSRRSQYGAAAAARCAAHSPAAAPESCYPPSR